MPPHEVERTNPQDQSSAPLLLFEADQRDPEPQQLDDLEPTDIQKGDPDAQYGRAFFVRALALLCACSLSIGSHYASYILSPLKSRLSREMGTSNTEFSLLISAFSLNSTWTPLVGGVLASKLGTTLTSILATGVIFLGQALLLWGDLTENVRLMAFGMFIFGLGVSPLAVVQETIIVRFFKSHGLGISMALGLVFGKGASFVSAHTSYPLTQKYGPHAPFYAATFLSALSVIVNLVYIAASKWLISGSGTELEASEIHEEARRRSRHNFSEAQALERVAEKRKVNLRDVVKLGDVFWAYMGLNVLCGILWSPFTHLAANIIERRYDLSESEASNQASYLLAGSVILYPIVGFVVDRIKRRSMVTRLFMLSSCLTMFCYAWLALPPSWTGTSIPAIASFGTGIGFSPLLLVIIVPQLVPHKYVSTTLGAHKSLEQTGSTISQTLAGLSLDATRKNLPGSSNGAASQHLLNAFFFFNILQFLSIAGLSRLEKRRRRMALTIGADDDSSIHKPSGRTEEDTPAIDPSSTPEQRRPLLPPITGPTYAGESRTSSRREKDRKQGVVFVWMSGALIAFAWLLFMGTAWLRLRSKEDRGSPSSH